MADLCQTGRIWGNELWAIQFEWPNLDTLGSNKYNTYMANAANFTGRTSEMKPEVHAAWLEYSSGTLSKENLRLRLRLIHPALQMRRGNFF
jgi:hypothetical protein